MLNVQPVLNDEVVTLKKLKASDTGALYIMRSDKELCRKAGLSIDLSLGQTYIFIKNVDKKIRNLEFFYWGIFVDKELVGVISLWSIDYLDKSGELGYFIGSNYLRNGYMTRAIKLVVNYVLLNTPLTAVTAYIETSNLPSQKLVEKIGFKKIKESIEEDMADTFVPMYLYKIKETIK